MNNTEEIVSREEYENETEQQHVRYYSLKDYTPEEMMEDYYAEEEEEMIEDMLDDGWVFVGSFDKDTTEAEFDALAERIADMME